jgi:hypothetical protein
MADTTLTPADTPVTQPPVTQPPAMQPLATEPPAEPEEPRAALGPVPTVVAVVLILIFIGLLFLLISMRDDEHWDRLVYLFTGYEAIVFAGAGALFGTTVQRANITAARRDAAAAKGEAKAERNRAEAAALDATAGRMLSEVVKVKASTRPARTAPRQGARPDEATDPLHETEAAVDPDLAELAELAERMFPSG